MTTNVKRSCGQCTQCCKTMAVLELAKPKNTWCDHCRIGFGCKVYETRPQSCRDFECLWLQGIGHDSLRPDRSKIVMSVANNGKTLHAVIDPTRPGAMQHRHFQAIVKQMNEGGYDVIISCGSEKHFLGSRPDRHATFFVDKDGNEKCRVGDGNDHTDDGVKGHAALPRN